MKSYHFLLLVISPAVVKKWLLKEFAVDY